ncbi:gamete expressed 1-like protein [Tanacetum coccineum]
MNRQKRIRQKLTRRLKFYCRVAQQQLISLGYSQQQELIQGIEQLKKDHDHLAEKSKTILAGSELGVTLLIKIVVLRYGNDVEQQQWIIDNIRLLFIILASCQLMNAIYTYRDYDSLNHQMLQTLVDKVNKLRNKNDDDGYNDDVDWSSWIDSDITEDELDDLEYVPPKGVPETSFITTSFMKKNYNPCRGSRH